MPVVVREDEEDVARGGGGLTAKNAKERNEKEEAMCVHAKGGGCPPGSIRAEFRTMEAALRVLNEMEAELPSRRAVLLAGTAVLCQPFSTTAELAQAVFAQKEQRRRSLAALPVEEKYRHFLQLQRMVADSLRAAAKAAPKPWPIIG